MLLYFNKKIVAMKMVIQDIHLIMRHLKIGCFFM